MTRRTNLKMTTRILHINLSSLPTATPTHSTMRLQPKRKHMKLDPKQPPPWLNFMPEELRGLPTATLSPFSTDLAKGHNIDILASASRAL